MQARHCFAVCLLALCQAGCSDPPATDPGNPTPQNSEEVLGLTALENRAVAQMGQFEYGKAVTAFEQLLDADGSSTDDNERNTVNLAIALLNRREPGDLDRAAKLLEETLKSDEPQLRAAYCRALLYFHAGDTEAARKLFVSVAEGDPEDSYARFYVGQCHFLAGEFEEALESFLTAQQLDPYLRSAPYGAFQAAQRLGDREGARKHLAVFQRLATNPRSRLAELKYTRMGPKAVALTRAATESVEAALPEGALFAEPRPLPVKGVEGLEWALPGESDTQPSITIADINGDGQSDLFIAGAFVPADGGPSNAVLLAEAESYRLSTEHPIANVKAVNTALWGDFDNDGLTDTYLCRRGPNQLWKAGGDGTWEDVTDATATGGGGADTVDGAVFDADHDGDLDYLLINAAAAPDLLSNNRNGSFRSISAEMGLGNAAADGRQALIADLDADDDADLVIVRESPPHDFFINDRFWEYRRTEGVESLRQSDIRAAVAGDADVDGHVELYVSGLGGITAWRRAPSGEWKGTEVLGADDGATPFESLALLDVDGDALPELLCFGERDWMVVDLSTSKTVKHQGHVGPNRAIQAAAVAVQPGGPKVVVMPGGEGPVVWEAGPARHPMAIVSFTGRTDKAAEMRTNASGIGVLGHARIGERWATVPPYRWDSGPGQSLQPVVIGAAGAEKIDFLRLLWPDGVSQTELDLGVGEQHRIIETQRQAGSCPLVFVWDGERYVFVADLLGAGGIGFNLGRAEYYPPRPSENLLLPEGLLQPRDGRLRVKLGEPMEELCYFDAVRLVAYDLPPGWQMGLDERFGASGPQPTGDPFFYREQIVPTDAVNDRGRDITAEISSVDRVAAPLVNDRQFTGLAEPHSVEFGFDRPIDELTRPVLLMHGWVEYAYSQSAFAAWQAGVGFTEPTLEAQGSDGQWRVIAERFGYMAGTARECSLPIPVESLPAGTRRLRLSTNMEVYWDRLAVVDAAEKPQLRRHELDLETAVVADVGFSARRLGDQRFTTYDYGRRPPLGDSRHPSGFYTSFGDARELVVESDNALAIIGPGEEVHFEYRAPLEPLPPGWTRHYVLEADGWCKDADLFTQDSGTVEPLPYRQELKSEASERRRQELHDKYNRRFRSGY